MSRARRVIHRAPLTLRSYLSIPAMAFHCLVMGKNSTWSRKQMAVVMERHSDPKVCPPHAVAAAPRAPSDCRAQTLVAHVVEFPKKKIAAQLFEASIELMKHLKAMHAAKGAARRESVHEADHHDDEDEDQEYISILVN